MNKDERENMIERLQAENAAMIEDTAARRYQRELYGDYDDLPLQQYQPRAQRPAQPAQPAQPDVMTAVLALADEIGVVTGRLEREMRAEISALRAELGAKAAPMRDLQLKYR